MFYFFGMARCLLGAWAHGSIELQQQMAQCDSVGANWDLIQKNFDFQFETERIHLPRPWMLQPQVPSRRCGGSGEVSQKEDLHELWKNVEHWFNWFKDLSRQTCKFQWARKFTFSCHTKGSPLVQKGRLTFVFFTSALRRHRIHNCTNMREINPRSYLFNIFRLVR